MSKARLPTQRDVTDAIQFISDTWLSNPELLSTENRQQVQDLHRLQFASLGDSQAVMNMRSTEEGREFIDGWESNAVTLQQLYADYNEKFPDELLLSVSPDTAPVSTTTSRRHLIRFRNLCVYMGSRTRITTGEIRKFLCTTAEGREDLKAAGFRAISTEGRNGAHKVAHWIVDEGQLLRLLVHHCANSADELPVDLLNRIHYEVDHLDPKQYHGKPGILTDADVIANFALVPRWLNGVQQWKDGYGSGKIGYIGTVGHNIFRLYRVALSVGQPSTAQALRHLNHLFVHSDVCHRDDVHRDVWNAIGLGRSTKGFEGQSKIAIAGFRTNVAFNGRRISSYYTRRLQADVDADMQASAAPKEVEDDGPSIVDVSTAAAGPSSAMMIEEATKPAKPNARPKPTASTRKRPVAALDESSEDDGPCDDVVDGHTAEHTEPVEQNRVSVDTSTIESNANCRTSVITSIALDLASTTCKAASTSSIYMLDKKAEPPTETPMEAPGRRSSTQRHGFEDLGEDTLGLIFDHLPLHDLLNFKIICRVWRRQIRRAIKRGNDVSRLEVQYRRFASANAALIALNPDTRFHKRLVASKCKCLLKIWPELASSDDRHYVNDPEGLLSLLMRRMQPRLLQESPRFVQRDGCKTLCIFADVYGCDTDALATFVLACRAAGLEASAFVFDYKGLSSSRGLPSKKLREYVDCRRGKLAGVFI
jgi:hypothetical protein